VALPPGYREGLLTAITVFVAFTLAFLKYWSLETPGRWTWLGILSVAPLALGLALQLVALFRSLDLRDDEAATTASPSATSAGGSSRCWSAS